TRRRRPQGSIQRQTEPCLPTAARPYELITGRRRLAACKYLGRPVLAKVIPLNDEQVAFCAVTENAVRKHMSDAEYIKLVKNMRREMERIFGPAPGRAVGSQARAAGARRAAGPDRRGGSVKFAVESRLEPAADGPRKHGGPATSWEMGRPAVR